MEIDRLDLARMSTEEVMFEFYSLYVKLFTDFLPL